MKNKKGFTLIELLVVISIIGVLAINGIKILWYPTGKSKKRHR